MTDTWEIAFTRLANQVLCNLQPGNMMTDSKRKDKQAPIVRIVDMLLEHIVDTRASDLHIEPGRDGLNFRYRVDGMLCRYHNPLPLSLQPILTSRIKILAGMDTNEHQRPLDGHIIHLYENRKLDFRVASIPVQYGEKLVIRSLNGEEELRESKELGMTEENEALFHKLIHSPSGMLIVTGPMNSGKSTTLYAALQELNTSQRNIMTLEDPVEQQLAGINQIEVREKSGLTFARGLRAMLRMDADCIMIGEARDVETAQIAVRAALTGHLLLTTLHAKDSCSALYRLLEMGVQPYLLAATAAGIIAQRLVRHLCPHCKESYEIPEESPDACILRAYGLNGRLFYRPGGCEKCRGTGYLGRIALHEILSLDNELRTSLMQQQRLEYFRKKAMAQGLCTLQEDGLKKASMGLTTLEEIRRVLYGN